MYTLLNELKNLKQAIIEENSINKLIDMVNNCIELQEKAVEYTKKFLKDNYNLIIKDEKPKL